MTHSGETTGRRNRVTFQSLALTGSMPAVLLGLGPSPESKFDKTSYMVEVASAEEVKSNK